MGAMASQITSLTVVYSTVYSGVPAQMPNNAENVSICDVIMVFKLISPLMDYMNTGMWSYYLLDDWPFARYHQSLLHKQYKNQSTT